MVLDQRGDGDTGGQKPNYFSDILGFPPPRLSPFGPVEHQVCVAFEIHLRSKNAESISHVVSKGAVSPLFPAGRHRSIELLFLLFGINVQQKWSSCLQAWLKNNAASKSATTAVCRGVGLSGEAVAKRQIPEPSPSPLHPTSHRRSTTHRDKRAPGGKTTGGMRDCTHKQVQMS